MRIVVVDRGVEAEVDVRSVTPDASLHELLGHVTNRPLGVDVVVDGRTVSTTSTLGGAALTDGSIISLDGVDQLIATPKALVSIVQIGGLDSGGRVELRAGAYRIGPSRRRHDPTLRLGIAEHAAAEIHVAADAGVELRRTDHEPLTLSDGCYVRLGHRVFASAAVVETVSRRPLAGWRVTFNRPPRSVPPTGPKTLTINALDSQAPGDRRRLPLIAMVAPIPIGVAMATQIGPRGLIFAAMSPLMVLGSWLEERREHRRRKRRRVRLERQLEDDVRRQLVASVLAEQARRRSSTPTVAELCVRARTMSPQLWERRLDHPDALTAAVAVGDDCYNPPVEADRDVTEIVARARGGLPQLSLVPHTIDLRSHRAAGLVGRGRVTRPVLRSLICQLCTLHGPSDLQLSVVTADERADLWEWMKWLPHAADADGTMRMITSSDAAMRFAANWPEPASSDRWTRPAASALQRPVHLIVFDDPSLLNGRGSALRRIFDQNPSAIRLLLAAPTLDQLPAVCTDVVAIDQETCTRLSDSGSWIDLGTPIGIDEQVALEWSRTLSRLEDPELPLHEGAEMPDQVSLVGLLDLVEPKPSELAARWACASVARAVPVVIGVDALGPVVVDLVGDGPHALIAGTTGAGKSELLRTMICSLAAEYPPNLINFLLVDYKGGSAFDACAELPHTVAMVTDLDEHLGARVLRCLRAELTYRESRLRAAGVTSLSEHHQLDRRLPTADEPLPRLVVVVDEFATVAAELPDFMPSLIDVAQRGRSLGIHMVLATQRPAGVVDQKIKANTNLRLALRVQDDQDSHDVIGLGDAAQISRRHPGRGYLRTGSTDVTLLQSAYVTGATPAGTQRSNITVTPFVHRRQLNGHESQLARGDDHPASTERRIGTDVLEVESDLQALVGAAIQAAAASGIAEQRQPYPDPLPLDVTLDDLAAMSAVPADEVAFALVDLPDEQRRTIRTWRGGSGGNLLAFGASGSGTTTLLASLALAACRRWTADDVHLYVVDADANTLAPLGQLPHCGGYVRVAEEERLQRLVGLLVDELTVRREEVLRLGSAERVAESMPRILVLIDNLGALRQALEQHRLLADLLSDLERIVRDGAALGINVIATGRQERAASGAWMSSVSDRLLFRLADPNAYLSFGLRHSEVPDLVPGRALDVDSKFELHVARAANGDLGAAIETLSCRADRAWARRPKLVRSLPTTVHLEQVISAGDLSGDAWLVPVGLDAVRVEPMQITIRQADHLLVIGAGRSGRSSTLASLATTIKHHRADVPVAVLAPRGGPLELLDNSVWTTTNLDDVDRWVDRVLRNRVRRVVLLDDAERLPVAQMERLVTDADDLLTIIAATRPETPRSFQHWTRKLAASRLGVILRPSAGDGDALDVNLGHRLAPMPPGRAAIVEDGTAQIAQVALPW